MGKRLDRAIATLISASYGSADQSASCESRLRDSQLADAAEAEIKYLYHRHAARCAVRALNVKQSCQE